MANKMNEELQKTTQSRIDIRFKWLTEAIKAQFLAGFLPEKIQNLKIDTMDLSHDEKELLITVYGGEEAHQVLKECGTIGFKPNYSAFGKFWYLTDGVMDLSSGHTAVFTVYHTDKPPKCHIEKRTKTVTEEVAVCEETGKEL